MSSHTQPSTRIPLSHELSGCICARKRIAGPGQLWDVPGVRARPAQMQEAHQLRRACPTGRRRSFHTRANPDLVCLVHAGPLPHVSPPIWTFTPDHPCWACWLQAWILRRVPHGRFGACGEAGAGAGGWPQDSRYVQDTDLPRGACSRGGMGSGGEGKSAAGCGKACVHAAAVMAHRLAVAVIVGWK
eukprot:364857-Chlamydomonas_euryale.AAC.5